MLATSAEEGKEKKLIMRALLTVLVFLWTVTSGAPAHGQNPSLKELNERAVRLYELGSYNEAAELAEEALRTAERDLGRNDPHLTTFLNNLAVIYYAQEKYAEAKLLYERALGIERKNFSSDKTQLISLMKSVEKCRQKLTDKEKTPGENEAVGEADVQYAPPSVKAENVRESAKDEKEAEERDSADRKMSQEIFKVQVGAFRSLSGAKSLQERLYEKGYRAYITSSATRKGETLYKVQIGEFSERDQALAASIEIKKSTGLKAFVAAN